MKMQKLGMEDWLTENQKTEINLAESGIPDFNVREILSSCKITQKELGEISLENPSPWGSVELRNEIAKQYLTVKTENVLVTTGTSEALFAFFNSVLIKGDEVVVQFPSFQPLYQLPIAIGCKIKFISMLEKNFELDLGKLEKAVNKKTKLIVINSPHNPTGKIIPEVQLKEIIRIAEENDCFVLFDEHYRFLSFKGKNIVSGYDLNSGYEKVFATGSIVKCFGVMGLRVGWLIGNKKELIECRNYKDYLTHVTPSLSDFFALKVLKNKNKILPEIINRTEFNINCLNEFMESNSNYFDYVVPEAGAVCFPKIKFSKDSSKFCRTLLKKYSVSVLPSNQSFQVKGYFRMNFTLQEQIFLESLERMGKCVENFL